MGAYNTFLYDDDFYDMPSLPPKIYRRTFHRVKLGMIAHRDIGKKIIFRGRHGNGFYGSILNQLYYDKFYYVVPSSINNPQGEDSRKAFATAVYNWKNVLTDEEKAVYHKRAVRRGKMSGYNLYIGEYVEANT
jgi:hypothetical protein